MAFKMDVSYLLPLLLLSTGCTCAPASYTTGGKIGFRNDFDGTFGGKNYLTHQGLSARAEGSSIAGASWRPQVYGGAYVQNDKNMYVADTSLGANLENYINPRLSVGGGLDGKLPLEFLPGIRVHNDNSIDPKAGVHTGEEAWQRANFYGGGLPDYMQPWRPSGDIY